MTSSTFSHSTVRLGSLIIILNWNVNCCWTHHLCKYVKCVMFWIKDLKSFMQKIRRKKFFFFGRKRVFQLHWNEILQVSMHRNEFLWIYEMKFMWRKLIFFFFFFFFSNIYDSRHDGEERITKTRTIFFIFMAEFKEAARERERESTKKNFNNFLRR